MRVVIGSARIDENGNITGGKIGDQTGKEVSTQNFYVHKKGWLILRPKVPQVALSIAKAMLEACNNNNIGYDQTNRDGIIKCLRKYGSIGSISEKTEADCSSTVRACCMQTGFDPGNFNTASEAKSLFATGQFLEPMEYSSKTKLYTGDVLVTKTKGHTVVLVEGYSRLKTTNSVKENIYPEPKRIIKRGCTGDDVKWVQYELVESGAVLSIDGEVGPITENAIKAFQKLCKLEIDGKAGPITIKALKNSK